MLLAELVADVEIAALVCEMSGDGVNVDIRDVALSTDEMLPNSLFCCVRGAKVDGHDFAGEAIAKGAVALLVEHKLDIDVPQIVVRDVRVAVGPFASVLAGRPSTKMAVLGVTGTNGKTTTTQIVAHVLRSCGYDPLVIGTLSGKLTTPQAPELQRAFAAHLRQASPDAKPVVVMEVSSHAVDQHRIDGTTYEIVGFTNLTQDHLDYHVTMDRYFEAKAALFTERYAKTGVVFVGDVWAKQLAATAQIPIVAISIADVIDLEVGSTGSRFVWNGQEVSLGLGGRFNVANALLAASICLTFGLDPAQIAAALGTMLPVHGRYEPVVEGQDFSVIVDYAHTPDGLENVLRTAREQTDMLKSRVIVVFGCGGDRDRGKRPQMGAAAMELGDLAILTSDNPRSEDPLAIIHEVEVGAMAAAHVRAELVIEPDRSLAIYLAIRAAAVGDIVLIAGKGHEQGQIIGDKTIPFDDREVARSALFERLSLK